MHSMRRGIVGRVGGFTALCAILLLSFALAHEEFLARFRTTALDATSHERIQTHDMKTSSFARRGLIAAALMAAAPLAFAHAYPKVQQPGPGTKVSAPHKVTIEFTEALEPTFSSMYVTTESGT